jgi:hypothetical protein
MQNNTGPTTANRRMNSASGIKNLLKQVAFGVNNVF